jgi:hypothetical protein
MLPVAARNEGAEFPRQGLGLLVGELQVHALDIGLRRPAALRTDKRVFLPTAFSPFRLTDRGSSEMGLHGLFGCLPIHHW